MLTILATTLLAALPMVQTADTILLTDGKIITDVRITSETFTEVTYKKGTTEGRRAAEKVLEVRHDLGAKALGDYAVAVTLMDDGDFAAAAARFAAVLEDGVAEQTRYTWVQQHAMWRRIRCLNGLGDSAAMSAEVDRLLASVPDTFFYAPALLMKAQALIGANDNSGARKVFQQLEGEVTSKGLPDRWAREAELGLAIVDDSMDATAKQRKLQGLAEKNAVSYPTVANRARVEVGNVMVASGAYADARSFFQSIIDSGSADPLTVAAALSGLGDCAYEQGLISTDTAKSKALFEEAALAHLQVAAYYREAARLRPRSMFYASHSIYRAGGENAVEDSRAILRKLNSEYGNSSWTIKLFDALGVARSN
jgi:TolA-binding protein